MATNGVVLLEQPDLAKSPVRPRQRQRGPRWAGERTSGGFNAIDQSVMAITSVETICRHAVSVRELKARFRRVRCARVIGSLPRPSFWLPRSDLRPPRHCLNASFVLVLQRLRSLV